MSELGKNIPELLNRTWISISSWLNGEIPGHSKADSARCCQATGAHRRRTHVNYDPAGHAWRESMPNLPANLGGV